MYTYIYAQVFVTSYYTYLFNILYKNVCSSHNWICYFEKVTCTCTCAGRTSGLLELTSRISTVFIDKRSVPSYLFKRGENKEGRESFMMEETQNKNKKSHVTFSKQAIQLCFQIIFRVFQPRSSKQLSCIFGFTGWFAFFIPRQLCTIT
jgi:hypothetical protein